MLEKLKSILKFIQDFSEDYARARFESAKRNGSFLE